MHATFPVLKKDFFADARSFREFFPFTACAVSSAAASFPQGKATVIRYGITVALPWKVYSRREAKKMNLQRLDTTGNNPGFIIIAG